MNKLKIKGYYAINGDKRNGLPDVVYIAAINKKQAIRKASRTFKNHSFFLTRIVTYVCNIPERPTFQVVQEMGQSK